MYLKFPSMQMTVHSLILSKLNTSILLLVESIQPLDVMEWVNCNRLCVNVEKTSCLVFSYRGEASIGDTVINDEILKRQHFVKYLGFNLDNHLTFKNHIDSVSSRISKAVGLLYKLNGTLPLSAL